MEALELAPILSDELSQSSETAIHSSGETIHGNCTYVTKNNVTKVSYGTLLCTNRAFALYLCSYITNHVGEWLTYLASLTALSQMHKNNNAKDENNNESTTIGILVAVRLLTNVAASPWGGALADAMDRRNAMILLDLAGAIMAWVFLAAVSFQSPSLILIATFLQQIDAGLYEPSRTAIVPLLCPSDGELEKGTLLTGMAWSAVAAVASAAGGVLVNLLGLAGCFIVDSLTYVVSALFMTCMDIDPSVTAAKTNGISSSVDGESHEQLTFASSSSTSPWTMVKEGWVYLRHQSWGPLVALKFSATWLTMDVLMVSFAQRGQEEDNTSLRLGALFGAVGVGCLIGPPLTDQFTTLQRPQTVQWAAVIALGLSTLACLTISLGILGNPLWLLCALTVLRSSGIAILWIQSSLLLQKLCDPVYLGRISSIDYGLALGGEALSALVTGRLRDAAGWSPENVCAWLSTLGVAFTISWIAFTLRGGGAALSVAQCSSVRCKEGSLMSSLKIEEEEEGIDELEETESMLMK